jgi:hypothetical protein
MSLRVGRRILAVFAVFVFVGGQVLCLQNCAACANVSSGVKHCCQSGSKSPAPAPARTQICLWQNAAIIQETANPALSSPELIFPPVERDALCSTALLSRAATAFSSETLPARLRPELSLGKSARSLAPPWFV